MPEPGAERVPSPEFQRASQELMLHIANGDFDTSHTAHLNKSPSGIAKRSFDALDAQQRKAQEDEQELYDAVHKKTLEGLGWPQEKITSEQLRHMHMRVWAMKESGRIQGIFKDITNRFQNNEEQKQRAHMQVVSALDKLHIVIDNGTDLENFADQLYKTTSNTTGDAGKFYETFCTDDMNTKLLNALTEVDIIAIKAFLIDTLGSTDAYNALLATKQTQDVISAKQNFATESVLLQSNEQRIVDYFKKGVALISKKSEQQVIQVIQPSTEQPVSQQEQSPTETTGGTATEQAAHHKENEDNSFFDPVAMRGGVFDGASGHYRGDLASTTAQKTVQESLATLPPNATFEQTQEALVKAMQLANQRVLQIPFPQNERRPVTTGTIFQIWKGPDGERKLIWVSIGDSRLWIRTASGDIHYLTRDDNLLKRAVLTGQMESGEYNDIRRKIDNAQTQEDIDSLGSHWNQATVTAMLGDENVTFQPGSIDLDPNEIIFLTTDGVHDNLSRQQIAEIARQTADSRKLAERLTASAKEVSLANAPRSKPDDITVVALGVGDFEKSISMQHTAEEATIQNVEKIIASLRQPGIRRLGKEIIFTNEEIQQMQTFAQEVQTLLDANPQLQDLLKTITHYAAIDAGFSIAVGFANTGIVANPDITAPRVVPATADQSTRIQVPPQLFTLYTAHANVDFASSSLQKYQDTLTTGGTGTLGSFLALSLEKTLDGYRQLKGLAQS